MSSTGEGLESRCLLRLSNEKSFHRCTLLSLSTLPLPNTSITFRVGNTPLARTSHSAWGGDDTKPGGRERETYRKIAVVKKMACVAMATFRFIVYMCRFSIYHWHSMSGS